jgi:outer membrane protein TolC
MMGNVPANLEAALAQAGSNNQTLRLANADIDAAQALVKKAEADFMPKVFVEARVRGGHDIDGVEDRTSDYQAMVVLQWTLYNGGIGGSAKSGADSVTSAEALNRSCGLPGHAERSNRIWSPSWAPRLIPTSKWLAPIAISL